MLHDSKFEISTLQGVTSINGQHKLYQDNRWEQFIYPGDKCFVKHVSAQWWSSATSVSDLYLNARILSSRDALASRTFWNGS